MMKRWTMEQLEQTDDLTYAISVLNERRSQLNPYSPLAMKLQHTINTIAEIKAEKDNYISRVAGIAGASTSCTGGDDEIETEPDTMAEADDVAEQTEETDDE